MDMGLMVGFEISWTIRWASQQLNWFGLGTLHLWLRLWFGYSLVVQPLVAGLWQ